MSQRMGQILLAVALSAPALTAASTGTVETVPISAGAKALLERTLGPEATPAAEGGGRALFEAVLASEAFRGGSAGAFDVSVLVGSGKAAGADAEKLASALVETLSPAADVIARLWPAGGGGLISACRFRVVIAMDRAGYEQLVALLDHCERAGYSGWAPGNPLDTPEVRAAEVARTWEVQVFNLSHSAIAQRREHWIEHGVGYYSLAFVANRALRQGAWGLVPPWLSSGLTDELDLAAYGEAWVGQESWTGQTPGWFRAGWSGFVPEGSRPPPPVMGPPADLGVTVVKSGEPWLSYEASRTRHWSELIADLQSEAPASFARAAETESFLPRDRAAARCLLHLMLPAAGAGAGEPGRSKATKAGARSGAKSGAKSGAADGAKTSIKSTSRTGGKSDATTAAALDLSTSLTALLDARAATPPNGMPDSEPLPVLFARALGGVPAVDRLEALDSRALLTELGRPDLIARLEQAQAGEALALNDHRAQAAWLYEQTCEAATRTSLFQAFMEIEYLQQLAEWKALGPHLDAGLRAALKACKSYPKQERDVAAAGSAFRAGLTQTADDAAPAGGSKARGRSKGR